MKHVDGSQVMTLCCTATLCKESKNQNEFYRTANKKIKSSSGFRREAVSGS